MVDLMLDNNIIDIHGNVNSNVIEYIYIVFFTIFNISNNKSDKIECYECNLKEFMIQSYFEYWIFGKLWRKEKEFEQIYGKT